jgi:hypothetical protein
MPKTMTGCANDRYGPENEPATREGAWGDAVEDTWRQG